MAPSSKSIVPVEGELRGARDLESAALDRPAMVVGVDVHDAMSQQQLPEYLRRELEVRLFSCSCRSWNSMTMMRDCASNAADAPNSVSNSAPS